ncbi:MAG TPA: translation initiation factor IF-2 [Elusimicrobiota bacterium]|nr:translation initiation factor IF-2 [Elusimicrobiota bacterium]
MLKKSKDDESKDKPAKKTAKPGAAKKETKTAAKKASLTKTHIQRKPAAEDSPKQEASAPSLRPGGSIAPPKENLVSAFSLFKKTTKRRTSGTPSVTRLAPSTGLKPSDKASAPAHPEKEAAASPSPANAPQAPASETAAKAEAAKTPAPQARKDAPAEPPKPSSSAPPPSTPAKAPPAQEIKRSQPPNKPGHFRPFSRPMPHGARRPHQGGSHHRHNKPAPAPAAATAPSAGDKNALKPLAVPSMITVRELAEKMEVKPNDLIKKLMGLGIFATINQRLDMDAASIVSQEFGFELKVVAMYQEEEIEKKAKETENSENLKPRPPVVTVMGHVDHGKTSLLDAIRQSRVAEGEAGGITQHIGAYQVKTAKGEITFLDTPGHEAFTAMRARGAKVTDLVIIVVSAVDGVMPQTIEAIDHAKAAGVPIIVAVNKIDLPGANPQKIRQELSQHGLQPEEWGGKTIFVDVSAKKRLNIDQLLEMIILQAQILDLKANPERPGYGIVLEARLDPRRGSVTTVLIQSGTAKVSDAFVAGLCHGKIKAMLDDAETRIESAGPSTPIEILGTTGTPQAGDAFSVVRDERQAREIAEKRSLLYREQTLAHQRHMSLVGLKSQMGVKKELALVLKADVQGSLQAIKDSLEGLSTAEYRLRLIHSGVGNANESDVLLAEASDAVILLFHVQADTRAEEVAARDGIEIRKYDVIYDLIADVKAAMEGLLEPEIVEVPLGKAEVRQIFKVKGGAIAGSFVLEGKLARGASVKIFRGGATLHEGKISSLKRFKDDVKEVDKGFDCGVGVDGFADYKTGDEIRAVTKETRIRRLNPAPPPHV